MVKRRGQLKTKNYKSIILGLLLFANSMNAQLKYVVEDFEGFTDGISDLKANGVFVFGNIKAAVKYKGTSKTYLGDRFITITKNGNLRYGGWGKGLGMNVTLDPSLDHLNFYLYFLGSTTNSIKIELQEDDNGNSIYEKNKDDSWDYIQPLQVMSEQNKSGWKLISIPLYKFRDSNTGGDGLFNINYKDGRLFTVIFSLIDSTKQGTNDIPTMSFDFICFSKGKLPRGRELIDLPLASPDDYAGIGAWSKEGNTADFSDIALNFEKNFDSKKKLGIVHFFQPFAVDGGSVQNHYPSVERINKVIRNGYIPMITLEDHFVNANSRTKQPNLYSIVEGHMDPFFADWAKQIKQVNGVVLLRILHEFNGDWYPWCIAKNDKDPKLLIKAFIHIHDIFNAQNVKNVKFIWCPNSISFPQESWNYIMDAFPGNQYVDYVGLDVYNGAGKSTTWRSFRKEGIENYFTLTQQLPGKPLLICETASRERESSEPRQAQDKAEWIRQMSEAITTDMSKIRLLTWFNEKGTFKINSSVAAKNAFQYYILKNDYFKSGTEYMNNWFDISVK